MILSEYDNYQTKGRHEKHNKHTIDGTRTHLVAIQVILGHAQSFSEQRPYVDLFPVI